VNDAVFVPLAGGARRQLSSFHPADKAGSVWEKYFARGRHPVDMGMSDADLQAVVKYLVKHAADSDQPAAAVIPK
jgi:hypothetical protein